MFGFQGPIAAMVQNHRMETPPFLIAVYLLRIAKHSGEPGYFRKRLQGASAKRALREANYVRACVKIDAIYPSDSSFTLEFDDTKFSDEAGAVFETVGLAEKVTLPTTFVISAFGKSAIVDFLVGWLFRLASTVIAATIAASVGRIVQSAW